MSDTKHIDAAILAAQIAVAPLAKTATAKVGSKGGQSFSYKFVPGEALVAHGLQALHEHGVSWEVTWEPFDLLGSMWLRVIVRLCHPESGEVAERQYPMPVKGRGDADKAVAGALTYCKGYAMAALCGIIREDEAREHPDRRGESLGDREPEYRPARKPDPVLALKADLGRYVAELAKLRGCQVTDARKTVFEKHQYTGDRPTVADYEQWVDAAKVLITAEKRSKVA